MLLEDAEAETILEDSVGVKKKKKDLKTVQDLTTTYLTLEAFLACEGTGVLQEELKPAHILHVRLRGQSVSSHALMNSATLTCRLLEKTAVRRSLTALGRTKTIVD